MVVHLKSSICGAVSWHFAWHRPVLFVVCFQSAGLLEVISIVIEVEMDVAEVEGEQVLQR
jgi:hypothetical protein